MRSHHRRRRGCAATSNVDVLAGESAAIPNDVNIDGTDPTAFLPGRAAALDMNMNDISNQV
jgi:hypothetical protein